MKQNNGKKVQLIKLKSGFMSDYKKLPLHDRLLAKNDVTDGFEDEGIDYKVVWIKNIKVGKKNCIDVLYEPL